MTDDERTFLRLLDELGRVFNRPAFLEPFRREAALSFQDGVPLEKRYAQAMNVLSFYGGMGSLNDQTHLPAADQAVIAALREHVDRLLRDYWRQMGREYHEETFERLPTGALVRWVPGTTAMVHPDGSRRIVPDEPWVREQTWTIAGDGGRDLTNMPLYLITQGSKGQLIRHEAVAPTGEMAPTSPARPAPPASTAPSEAAPPADLPVEPSCPACGPEWERPEIDWPPTPAHERFAKSLREVEPLKTGALYECGTCRSPWFLKGDGKSMKPLSSRDGREHARWWGRTDLRLPAPLFAKVAAIGGAQPRYGGGIAVPCKLVTKKGAVYERAMVCFMAEPPGTFGEPHFADEIAEVLPSDYALPLEARNATLRLSPDEVAFLKAPDGRTFGVNAATMFFEIDSWKGAQMVLAGPPAAGGTVRVVRERINLIAPFFADMTPDAEGLRWTSSKS